MTIIPFSTGYRPREGGAIEFLPLSMLAAIGTLNKALKADKEKPADRISFDGGISAVHAATFIDLLRLRVPRAAHGGESSFILTPSKNTLYQNNSNSAIMGRAIICTGYYLWESAPGTSCTTHDSWKAFLRAKPVEDVARAAHVPRVAHVQTVAAWQAEPVEPRYIPDPWLQRAVSKDPVRPDFGKVGGNIATDGYRIHYRRDLEQREYPRREQVETLLASARRAQNTIVHLSAAALRDLLKVCNRAKKMKSSLHLSFNGNIEYAFEVSQYSDDETMSTGKIISGYYHSGADVDVILNPKYLEEAIDKPTDKTWILVGAGKSYVYLTDGICREALIAQQN